LDDRIVSLNRSRADAGVHANFSFPAQDRFRGGPVTKAKKVLFWTTLVGATIGGMFCVGEALVWMVSPVPYLYPRYQSSPEYGLIPYPNVVMVHALPRNYGFRYTTDAFSCRTTSGAEAVRDESLPLVVVLGDSYSFGIGVSDGEEYPAVMKRALSGQVEVLNLGAPGWGLTQEIRRYFELGSGRDPRLIILQFCANDLNDNLVYPVVQVSNGEFVFVKSGNTLTWVKKYLSRSWLQRTQLYNFARARGAQVLAQRISARETERLASEASATSGREAEVPQQAYIELLETFAQQVREEGLDLILISVDRQIDQFPRVRASVDQLNARGVLRYVEVTDWLDALAPYASPEGHLWGTSAHRVVGDSLASIVAASCLPVVVPPSASAEEVFPER